MSYIDDIKTIFETVSAGTFMFTSEMRADDRSRNIASASFPIFLIDDSPLITEISIDRGATAQDSPKLKIYCLTKYGDSGREINESNSTRLEQHNECVVPMKSLAIRVLGKYLREGEGVLRQAGAKEKFRVEDRYNTWSKMLYGVSGEVSKLRLRCMINYGEF